MKVILYCRVSTPAQSNSLKVQEAVGREYCRKKGYQVRVVKEIASAYHSDPPILASLAERGARAPTILLFQEISRISRNYVRGRELIAKLEAAGYQLVSLYSGLGNRELRQAEEESRRLGQRVRLSYLRRRGLGEAIGRPPYGYRKINRRLVPDKDEQAFLEELPNLSYGEVERRGFRNRNGQVWTKSQLDYLKRRKKIYLK